MWSDGLSHPRSPQACGVSGGAAARGGEGCWLLINPEVFASRSVLTPLSQFGMIGSKPAEQSLPPAPRESALRGAKAASQLPLETARVSISGGGWRFSRPGRFSWLSQSTARWCLALCPEPPEPRGLAGHTAARVPGEGAGPAAEGPPRAASRDRCGGVGRRGVSRLPRKDPVAINWDHLCHCRAF